MNNAHLINVKFEEGRTGLFYATSDNLRGLLVAAHTLDALNSDVPRAISELYAVRGLQTKVIPVESDRRDNHPWVVIPT